MEMIVDKVGILMEGNIIKEGKLSDLVSHSVKSYEILFRGIDEEILPPSPLGNCGCPSPLNQEEEAYNMTPDATEEESKAVRDKFDKTYMQGGSEVAQELNQEVGENKLKEAFKSVAENVAMTPFITPISGVVTGLKTAYDIYKKNKK